MNKQNAKSFIWPAAALALLVFLSIHFHVNATGWVFGGGIYLAGLGKLIYDYVQDGEESMLPDLVMIIGAVIVLAFGVL